jgi:hypothetical protein
MDAWRFDVIRREVYIALKRRAMRTPGDLSILGVGEMVPQLPWEQAQRRFESCHLDYGHLIEAVLARKRPGN